MGAVIGTAIHAYLEERNLDAHALKEQHVTIGEIPGYGTVGSTTDLFLERVDNGRVVDWKGLTLDTPLPTPTGWTTMGEVRVGDDLIDGEGHPTTVIGKSKVKHLPGYKITFETGETVICDEDHLWNVSLGDARNEKKFTISAKDLSSSFGSSGTYRVYNSGALDLPDVDLQVDPYVLGVWLGDGHSDGARLTLGETKMGIVDEFEKRGVHLTEQTRANRTNNYSFAHQGFTQKFRSLGVLNNKHIPGVYLRASKAQRLDLLRGLMDTDGYYNHARKSVVMDTTSERQASDLVQLVLSLGWKTKSMPFTAKWQGGTKPAFMVSFRPDVNPFLVRNQDVMFIQPLRAMRRIIKKVEPIAEVTTQCVMVDSDEHTYLCTRDWIPTHNTTTLSKLKFIKRAWQDDPSDYDLSSVVSARSKINRYLNQVHLYALGVQNMGYEVHGLSLAFIPRDGKQLKRDLWSIDIDYDPERACKVWDRSVRLWQWLEAGNDYHQLPQHEGCFVCQQLRPLQGVDEIEL